MLSFHVGVSYKILFERKPPLDVYNQLCFGGITGASFLNQKPVRINYSPNTAPLRALLKKLDGEAPFPSDTIDQILPWLNRLFPDLFVPLLNELNNDWVGKTCGIGYLIPKFINHKLFMLHLFTMRQFFNIPMVGYYLPKICSASDDRNTIWKALVFLSKIPVSTWELIADSHHNFLDHGPTEWRKQFYSLGEVEERTKLADVFSLDACVAVQNPSGFSGTMNAEIYGLIPPIFLQDSKAFLTISNAFQKFRDGDHFVG